MNIFQASYEARLAEWYELRKQIQTLSTLDKCIKIDKWWQQAPLVSHYLHQHETKSWPNPWDLLVDNTYCTLARGLGMCYTLAMAASPDLRLVEATNEYGEDLFLVIADSQHVLNYWPDTVKTNSVSDFTIKEDIKIANLLNLK